MTTATYARAPSVLTVRRSEDSPRVQVPKAATLPMRTRQVLQSRSAPAQLSLFLRPGAVDVK